VQNPYLSESPTAISPQKQKQEQFLSKEIHGMNTLELIPGA
jgi:hypothetical protein